MTMSEPVADTPGVVGVGCLLLGLAGVTCPEPPTVGVSALVKGGGVPTRAGGGVLASVGVAILARGGDADAVEAAECNFNFFPTGVLACVGPVGGVPSMKSSDDVL